MIFLSTYENKIDAKGRVSVPASFRAVLEAQQQPLIITRSLTDDCLQGQGAQRMNQIVNVLDTMDSLSPEVQMLQAMLANAQEMKPDSEGRIMLPEDFLNFAELSTTVMFVGVGRLFEMWNPDTYRARAEAQRQHARTNGLPPLILNPSSNGGEMT
ncbi:MAG: division/cell wall cluster transcriptional repressor MraZ [Alphaproteobacteria bacterium]|nr:division/cell wall cluster transcriptional repressor MraZ [Alphaproteobacteria bacterium]